MFPTKEDKEEKQIYVNPLKIKRLVTPQTTQEQKLSEDLK